MNTEHPKIVYRGKHIVSGKGYMVTYDALTFDHFDTVIKPWCRENLEEPVRFFGTSSVFFKNIEDYALFILKWS